MPAATGCDVSVAGGVAGAACFSGRACQEHMLGMRGMIRTTDRSWSLLTITGFFPDAVILRAATGGG